LEDKLKGTHVIFSAGTGILPFIDFISLTGRYMNHKMKRRVTTLDENHMDKDESFDYISDDFKLMVFSTYQSNEGTIFYEECVKMNRLNDKYNLNAFHYHLRISSDRSKWNKEFMKEHLSAQKNYIEKIYLVGPISFMDEIKSSISRSELNLSSKVFMV
jgi:ferredoxin-NADP reductase